MMSVDDLLRLFDDNGKLLSQKLCAYGDIDGTHLKCGNVDVLAKDIATLLQSQAATIEQYKAALVNSLSYIMLVGAEKPITQNSLMLHTAIMQEIQQALSAPPAQKEAKK